MTDEQMDARLRSAGEAWRAAAAPPVEDTESTDVHPLTETPDRAQPRRRRTGLLASAAVVAAALVAGGSIVVANITGDGNDKSTGIESAGLQGTVWELVGVDNLDLGSSYSTLYITQDGQLVTDDTCTLFGAHVAADAGRLTVSDPQIRHYNCTDSVGELTFDPQVFLANPRYELTADGLIIRGDGSTLRLVPAAHLPAPTLDRPTLVGANWKLLKATGPDGNEVPIDGDARLRIDNGQLEASSSCNTLGGPVTVTGNQLDPGELQTTDISCGELGSLVAAVLTHPARTLLLGAHLTVGMTGAGTLEYQWVPDDAEATDPARLLDRAWHLTSVAGSPVTDRVVVNIHSDGTVTGSDGCGELTNADAQVGPGTLSIRGVTPPDVGSDSCNADVVSTVDSLLTQRNALWRIADGELIISGPGAQGFALVFQLPDPNPAPNQPPSLTGTPWNLVAIKDANGADIPVAGQANLTIDADGHLSGNDGCNSMSGDVRIVDRTMDFSGGLATTDMACLDADVTATAATVDGMLTGVVEWSVDGDRLTLYKDGAGTLIYSAGQPPTTSTDPADVIGKLWTLTTIESGTGPDGVASSVSRPASLQVFADRLELYGGCARYDATVGDGTMEVGSTDTSTVDCAAGMDDLDRIHDILVGRVAWMIVDGQLTITKDGVGALMYDLKADGGPLTGSIWNFETIQTDNSNSGSGSTTSAPTALLFDDDDSYRLVTGCHAYQGHYAVSGSTITFSNQRDLGGDDCLDTVAQQLVEFLDGTMTYQSVTETSTIGRTTHTLTKGNTKAVFTDPP